MLWILILLTFPASGYLRGDGSVDNRGAEGDPELHLPRPLRVDVLHHGGQHQGGHLGGPTDEDGPHHQGEPQVPRNVHQGVYQLYQLENMKLRQILLTSCSIFLFFISRVDSLSDNNVLIECSKSKMYKKYI